MAGLYVKITEIQENVVNCGIESLVLFFIYKYLNRGRRNLPLHLVIDKCEESLIHVDLADFEYIIKNQNEIDNLTSNCIFPLYSINEYYCISGLCAVLRQVISAKCEIIFKFFHGKYFQLIKSFQDDCWLLGFREACLSACAEFSIWTKFCEVDLISSVRQILTNKSSIIPEDLVRLEYHLLQPVRTHNIGKKKINCAEKKNIPTNEAMVEHCYVEGSEMFLSDLIIFPLINLCLNLYGMENLSLKFPTVFTWYNLMLSDVRVASSITIIINYYGSFMYSNLIVPEIKMESLYKCDPRRHKSSDKFFTKQEDVEHVLQVIDSLSILDDYKYKNDFILDVTLDWKTVPYHAHPQGGNLPENRLSRKVYQIENIVKSVLKIARKNDVIVDFCSGGGHVGILLAYLLPKCRIILLDNKEYSLKIAQDRMLSLNLKNVFVIQSNIDYFIGKFQIGVTLHACGVAADLVINNCILNRSKFVVAPCCYGKLQENHILNYPKSAIMTASLTEKDYMILSHSADQTHKEEYSKSNQGEKCMKSIDVDRCLHAEENNYEVHLAKMIPVTCSPKNNLIIGIPEELIDNRSAIKAYL